MTDLDIPGAAPALLHRPALHADGGEPAYDRWLSRHVPAAAAFRQRASRQGSDQAAESKTWTPTCRRLPAACRDDARLTARAAAIRALPPSGRSSATSP